MAFSKSLVFRMIWEHLTRTLTLCFASLVNRDPFFITLPNYATFDKGSPFYLIVSLGAREEQGSVMVSWVATQAATVFPPLPLAGPSDLHSVIPEQFSLCWFCPVSPRPPRPRAPPSLTWMPTAASSNDPASLTKCERQPSVRAFSPQCLRTRVSTCSSV